MSAGPRPAAITHGSTSRQPPHVRPVTARRGPAQRHGEAPAPGALADAARAVVVRARHRLARPELGERPRVQPVDAVVLRLPRLRDLQPPSRQQSGPQGRGVHLIHSRSRPQVHLGGTAVEARHAVRPQPLVQVGVVAVAEERLGVRAHGVRVQVTDHGDLVLPAHRGDHRPDLLVCERRVQVPRPVLGARPKLPGGGVLDRHQSGYLGQAAHRLLVHRGREAGSRERRRDDGDPVARLGLGRVDERLSHTGSVARGQLSVVPLTQTRPPASRPPGAPHP